MLGLDAFAPRGPAAPTLVLIEFFLQSVLAAVMTPLAIMPALGALGGGPDADFKGLGFGIRQVKIVRCFAPGWRYDTSPPDGYCTVTFGYRTVTC